MGKNKYFSKIVSDHICSRNLEAGMPVRLRNPITFEHIRKEGTMVDACVCFLDPKSRMR